MATKSDMTTKFTDVNVDLLKFTELEDNQRSKGQKIAYPRYTNPDNGSEVPLFIQFPWINMDSYGVPRIGEYYSDDSQRAFVKLPLDQSVSEIKQLCDMLQKMDNVLGSDEFKKKMFGNKAPKYKYQPIFRIPQEDDEDTKKDDKKDNGPKHPYMKLKIDTNFGDGQVKTIIFNSVLKDGKRVRTKIDGVKTINDFASHVCWKSRIHPVARPVKLWAQAPNKPDPSYGLTFKIAKIEVEPPNKINLNVKQFLESDAFLDSDEESDTVSVSTNNQSNATMSKKVAQVESDNEDDVPTKTTTSVQSGAIMGKKVAQVESDDESDDEPNNESEEQVTKPPTKSSTSKTPVKKVEESDAEEESDEEVKPVKKSSAKAVVSPAKTTSKSKKSAA